MTSSDVLKAIDEQIAVLSAMVQEISASINALKALKEKGEAMIPLGSGVFIRAKLNDDKVLVSVGANIMIDKDLDRAIELLEKRKAAVQEALDRTRQQRIKLAEQARRVRR